MYNSKAGFTDLFDGQSLENFLVQLKCNCPVIDKKSIMEEFESNLKRIVADAIFIIGKEIPGIIKHFEREYCFEFIGREKGAIGKEQELEFSVIANSEAEAENKLFEAYEIFSIVDSRETSFYYGNRD